MPPILLAGGWGYPNLGDEAILAGYLEWARSERIEAQVASCDPHRSASAQRLSPKFGSESKHFDFDTMLLGGGGYLNGAWLPEVTRKIRRLIELRDGRHLIAHAVEARDFSARDGIALRSLLAGGRLSVRDASSISELDGLGIYSSTVLPDAISLLYPHLSSYGGKAAEFGTMVAVNMLDVGRRPDRAQSEIDPDAYDRFTSELLIHLGDRALGLVIGEGDYKYMKRFSDLRIVEPKTVSSLITILRSVSGVVSVRMHPALIASQLGTPTVSIPYCGKVRGTLNRIGIQRLILDVPDLDRALELLQGSPNAHSEWLKANLVSSGWLKQAFTSFCDPSHSR